MHHSILPVAREKLKRHNVAFTVYVPGDDPPYPRCLCRRA